MQLFPELEFFPPADRAKALHRARHRTMGPRRVLVMVAASTLLALVMAVLMIFMKRQLGWDVSWMGAFTGAFAAIGSLTAANGFYRVPIQRELRRDLVSRGIPVCISCGYDLRGNVSGRCPECGSPSQVSGYPFDRNCRPRV